MSSISRIFKFTPALIIILISCGGQSRVQNDLLQKFYSLPSFEVGKNTKAVVFISDHNCATCNQMFVDFISKKIGRKDILFVVSSSMNKIDISQFLNTKNENIIYDNKKQLYYDDKLQTSMVFILNRDKVDTIIQVNSQEIDNQINYLNTIL